VRKVLRRSPQSARDYEQIYRHIAADNPDAAAKLLRSFDEKLDLILDQPKIGEARPQVGKDVRVLVVHRNYLLLYREGAEVIELIRVLHTARKHRARNA
jgi:toxin ParE1/3/4